jgi:hypothetical protein
MIGDGCLDELASFMYAFIHTKEAPYEITS